MDLNNNTAAFEKHTTARPSFYWHNYVSRLKIYGFFVFLQVPLFAGFPKHMVGFAARIHTPTLPLYLALSLA